MDELVIIDGYNFIFNFYRPKNTNHKKLEFFRERLLRDLAQYRNYKGFNIIVVFDAKHGFRNSRSSQIIDMIEVIYSRRGETADSVVEKLVHNNEKYKKIFVVTSDYMQQKVVFKQDIYRKSIREFAIELKDFKKKLEEEIQNLKRDAEKSFYILEKRVRKTSRSRLDDIRKNNTSN